MPLFEFQCAVDGNRFELLLSGLPEDETGACPLCGARSPLVWSMPVMKPDANWFYGEEVAGHGYLNSASKIARARKANGLVELGGRDDREAMKRIAAEGRAAQDARLEKAARRCFERAVIGTGVVDADGNATPEAMRKISDEPIKSTKDSRLRK